MEFKTLADIQGHFEIALDLLLKKENFSHGVWPYKLYQSEASCQYEKRGKRCAKEHQKGYVVGSGSTMQPDYVFSSDER